MKPQMAQPRQEGDEAGVGGIFPGVLIDIVRWRRGGQARRPRVPLLHPQDGDVRHGARPFGELRCQRRLRLIGFMDDGSPFKSCAGIEWSMTDTFADDGEAIQWLLDGEVKP